MRAKFRWGDRQDRNTLKVCAYTGDNINFKRQEIEWQAVGRDNLVLVKNKWHSLVDTLMKIWTLKNSGGWSKTKIQAEKFLTSLIQVRQLKHNYKTASMTHNFALKVQAIKLVK